MQDLLPAAERIAALLRGRGETLAVSESSAGGLIAAAMLAQTGASEYFLGGAVVYTGQARDALLGITDAMMNGIRSATEAYAALCAQTVRNRLGASWGVAEAGAAGPSGNRYGDKAGHACFAVAGPRIWTRTLETGDNHRVGNMHVFAATALSMLEAALHD
jgi:PncC family amidohydrolase